MNLILDLKFFLAFLILSLFGLPLQAKEYTPQDYSLIPPSPEVAKLLEYNELPVDYAHGTPDISYTLYTLKEGNLEVPIRVSYHGGGHRICSEPDNMNSDWSLLCTSVISRSAVGLPDDYYDSKGIKGSFYSTPQTIAYKNYVLNKEDSYNPSHLDQFKEKRLQYNFDAQDYYIGKADVGNDIFQLSGLGLSGTFIFDENRQITYSGDIPLKLQTSKIGLLTDFTVTTPEGMVYTYDCREESKRPIVLGDPDLINEYTVPDTIQFTSAWYLTSLRNINNDLITFEYEQKAPTYHSNTSERHLFYHHSRLSILFPKTEFADASFIAYNPVVLKKIKSKNCEIEICYLESANSWHRCIDIIDGIKVKTSDGKTIKYFSFKYNSAGFLTDILESADESAKSPDKQLYSFEYVEDKGRGRDYGGYCNDYDSHCTVPEKPVYGIYGADLSINPDYTDSRVLKRIIYPTGGYTELEWENNRYSYVNDYIIPEEEAATEYSDEVIYNLCGLIPAKYEKLKIENFSVRNGDIIKLDLRRYFCFDHALLEQDYYNNHYAPYDELYPNLNSDYPAVRFFRIDNGKKILERAYFIDYNTIEVQGKNLEIPVTVQPGTYTIELTDPRNISDKFGHIYDNFKDKYESGYIYLTRKTISVASTSRNAYWPGLRIGRIISTPAPGEPSIYKNFFYGEPKAYTGDGVIQRRPNHEYFYYINAPEPPIPDFDDYIPLPIPAQVSVIGSEAFPSTSSPSASIEYAMVKVMYSLKDILETSDLPQQNNTYYYTTAMDEENRDIAEKTYFAEMQPIGARKLTSKAFRRGILQKHVAGLSFEKDSGSDITDYEYNIYEDSIPHWFTTDFFLLCDNSRCIISNSPWCKNDYAIGRYRLIPYNKTVKRVSKIGSDNVKSTTRYEYFYSQYTDAIDYALVKSKAVSRSHGPEMVSHYTYMKKGGSTAFPEVETEIVTVGDDVINARRTVYSTNTHLPLATYSLGKTGYKKSQLVSDNKFTTEAMRQAINRPEYTYRYNQFGRIVEIRYRGRVLASYIWSYHGAYPIVEARGIGYDELIAGLNENDIYNSAAYPGEIFDGIIERMPNGDFTFNAYHNLIGVMESRDSRGGGRKYSYDDFGRLARIRDYQENILNKYRYVLSQE